MKKNQVDNFINQIILFIWKIIKTCQINDFTINLIKAIKAKYNCNEELASSLFRPIYWYLYINKNIIRYNYNLNKWEIDFIYKKLDKKKLNELIKGIKERYGLTLYYRIIHLKNYMN